MIPKSGNQFSVKIVRHKNERAGALNRAFVEPYGRYGQAAVGVAPEPSAFACSIGPRGAGP
jgi:hypothetical protein